MKWHRLTAFYLLIAFKLFHNYASCGMSSIYKNFRCPLPGDGIEVTKSTTTSEKSTTKHPHRQFSSRSLMRPLELNQEVSTIYFAQYVLLSPPRDEQAFSLEGDHEDYQDGKPRAVSHRFVFLHRAIRLLSGSEAT